MDSSKLRSQVPLPVWVYSEFIGREDWMEHESVAVVKFGNLIEDFSSEGEGFAFESIKAVPMGRDTGDVMKLLILASAKQQRALKRLIADLASCSVTGGIKVEIDGESTAIYCYKKETEARRGLEMEAASPRSGGSGGGGGGTVLRLIRPPSRISRRRW